MKKRVVLIGANSMLGKVLLNDINNKYDVITVGRKNCNINYNLLSEEIIQLPQNCDSLIHLAAQVKAKTDFEIEELIRINVLGTLKICIAAKKAGIKNLIYISSIFSYLDRSSKYYSYYSISKRQSEEIALKYCNDNNICLCILRPSQMIGPSVNDLYNQSLLLNMVKCAISNRDICIYGKNDALRNYIYVENVTNIIERLINKNVKGVYDIVDPYNYKLSEIANTIINVFNSKSKVFFDYEKDDISDNAFYSKNDIFQILSINTYIDLKTGVYKLKEESNIK